MKAIVLFSGGLDSTTCLALAIKRYGKENVLALTLYYGQRHKREIEASNKIVNYYQVEHKVLDLASIFKDSKCSLLAKNENEEIPLTSYNEQLKNEQIVSTYVPYRNGLFLSVAASIAVSLNASFIYYGAHKDDFAIAAYPDTSKEFNRAINRAIYLGSGKQVKVVAPFINKDKAGVVKAGLKLKVPYQDTYSCYLGHEKACGKCATCRDRQLAFYLNNTIDPAEYEVRLTKKEIENDENNK